MGKSYEVRCGKRLVSLQEAHSAREAVIEYLRSMGCRDSDMTTLSGKFARLVRCGVQSGATR